MRRSVLLAIIFAAGLLVSAAPAARAQDDEPKWEVGGQLYGFDVANGAATQEAVPLVCINPPCPTAVITTNGRSSEAGFGARVGRAVNRYVSLEAEVNYFPRERELTDESFTGGRKLQGLFGVKVGKRYESFGVFAKARPGFVNFEQGDLQGRPNVLCPAIFPRPLGCFEPKGRTDFALDLGGVLELYPSRGTFIRFDAGDTILRADAHTVPGQFRSSNGVLINNVAVGLPAETTHNFQGGVGFGFRF
jgi:hypothetical protein